VTIPGLTWERKRCTVNPLVGVIDELHAASYPDDKPGRDVIGCDIRTRYLFTKKASADGVSSHGLVAKQGGQPVAIRLGQDDRRSLRRAHFTGVA
jgi:hypothetical protein